MKNDDIGITLFESLSFSYKYLITTLEIMSMKGRTMEYKTAYLMHEMSKRKEKESQVMMSQ